MSNQESTRYRPGQHGPWRRTPGQLQDYAWLRSSLGETREAAARRLGVSVRTAQRYERRLRDAGQGLTA